MDALMRLCLSLQTFGWMGLADNEDLKFSAIAASAKGARSTVHGRGLFAITDIPKGSVAAFYPVHALGDSVRFFQVDADADIYGGTKHQAYRVALPPSPGLVAWGATDLWVDSNPAKPEFDGFCAHLVNDAEQFTSTEELDILAYYERVGASSNCRLVSFGDTPLICWVATKTIEAGSELLGTYGHDYWCAAHAGSVPPYTTDVAEADERWHEESRRWRRVVQEEYEREIAEISNLVHDSYEEADKTSRGKISE